jgi:hypothetical protein
VCWSLLPPSTITYSHPAIISCFLLCRFCYLFLINRQAIPSFQNLLKICCISLPTLFYLPHPSLIPFTTQHVSHNNTLAHHTSHIMQYTSTSRITQCTSHITHHASHIHNMYHASCNIQYASCIHIMHHAIHNMHHTSNNNYENKSK